MKIAISKSTLMAFGLMLLILPGLVSCKKDKDNDELPLRDQLAGEWEIQSFTIDGLEMMGFALNSSVLEFEPTAEAQGDYEWLFAYTDGSNVTTSGVYDVDEDSEELILDSNTAEELRYDIVDHKGGRLELYGIVSGSEYELTLKRQ